MYTVATSPLALRCQDGLLCDAIFRGVVPWFVCENIIDVNVKAQHNSNLLQPLRWRCVECVIHHERDVREEQHPYTVEIV